MSFRFEDYDVGELPWLDRPDAQQAIAAKLAAQEIDQEEAQLLRRWTEQGYITLQGVLPQETACAIATDIDELVAEHQEEPLEVLRERLNNAFPDSAATRKALVQPRVLEVLDLLLGKRMVPHQTLSLPVSSQQDEHSDQILMSTHPAGYMAAVWFALEDIDDECGPLVVHPGSHRWPYVSAQDVGIPKDSDQAQCDSIYNEHYYGMIAGRVAKGDSEPFEFIPKRGDLLIWHSNLIHGARRISRAGATRRSLIAHYYAEDVEHYSDLYGHAVSSRDLRTTEA
jgi:hypothetical protein